MADDWTIIYMNIKASRSKSARDENGKFRPICIIHKLLFGIPKHTKCIKPRERQSQNIGAPKVDS